MDKQEIFDTVANHLFTQARRSFDPVRGACMYRGPNGTKCAVGCLIPDEDYNPKMDTGVLGVYKLVDWNYCPEFRPFLPLLCALQNTHDRITNWDSRDTMRSALAVVADNYKLDASSIEKQTGDW